MSFRTLATTLAWLSGQASAAHKHWRRSVEEAEKSAFPIERAKTLMEIGRRGADTGLVEQAAGIFRQSGANVPLAFALHALAQLHGQSCDNAAATVQKYTLAIAALEAVDADGEAALARRQHAHLQAQLS